LRIPNATPDIESAFKEVWNAIDRLTNQNIDMKSRKIINSGAPVQPYDLMRKCDVDNNYNFTSFYFQLKAKGLNDFPGKLSELQDAAVEITTSSAAPKVTDVGRIFFETDTGSLKFCNGTGYTTITYQSITGLYAARPSASGVSDGVMYYATDQNSMYTVNTGAWKYLCGWISGAEASRPTLAAGDVGFRYFDTDLSSELYWTGTAWANV
jgi:hypothetical protein